MAQSDISTGLPSVRAIYRIASQNYRPSPQPHAAEWFTSTRELHLAFRYCVTTLSRPSPTRLAGPFRLSRATFRRQVCTPTRSRRPHLFNCDTLKFPRVPARVSEALVLRTYPFKEADLVVSFLTRDQGKLRGVAKRARRPKSTFGSGLERLSHVRMAYFQRESHELVNLDSCELIRSQFDLVTSYQASIALDYFAEASELLLPSAEPSEKFFRLLLAVLESLRPAAGEIGRAHV